MKHFHASIDSADVPHHGLVCFGGRYDTPEAFAAVCWQNAEFYARDRGYSVSCASESHCGECFGEGRTAPKRSGSRGAVCKACKGTGL